MGSKSFSFNKSDLLKVVKNAALVGVAAFLTYAGQNLTKIDLGPLGVMLVPVITVLIDSSVKWVNDNTKSEKV
jgi:hypothetical protein